MDLFNMINREFLNFIRRLGDIFLFFKLQFSTFVANSWYCGECQSSNHEGPTFTPTGSRCGKVQFPWKPEKQRNLKWKHVLASETMSRRPKT